tara:strand:+ start:54749 stop:55639 length:891 start_codon:yes stop_codon:yes gene_type:complete
MKSYIGCLLFLIPVLSNAQCLTGDCENGYGKYSCDCGYVYEGEFLNGQKVNGTLTKKDLVYTGTFEDDLASGYGVMKYKDGSWFEGTFKANAPHGYGTYNFKKGQLYKGEIFEGSFAGLGVLIYKDEDGRIVETQIGHFDEDQLNGMGASISYNGDIYFGEFSNGDYMGFGAYIFAETETAEAGEFHKKKLHTDVLLQDYPERGSFGVKGYSVDSLSFDLVGNVYGTNMLITVSNSANQSLYIYYDNAKKEFFMSTFNHETKGQLVDLEGRIYEAIIEMGDSITIQKVTQLYTKGK